MKAFISWEHNIYLSYCVNMSFASRQWWSGGSVRVVRFGEGWGGVGVMVPGLLWSLHQQDSAAESRLAQWACGEWHFLSVLSGGEPRQWGPDTETSPPLISTTTNNPQWGREGRLGDLVIYVTPTCTSSPSFIPSPSLALLQRWKAPHPASLPALIGFVAVSRQTDFWALTKEKSCCSSDLTAPWSGST